MVMNAPWVMVVVKFHFLNIGVSKSRYEYFDGNSMRLCSAVKYFGDIDIAKLAWVLWAIVTMGQQWVQRPARFRRKKLMSQKILISQSLSLS